MITLDRERPFDKAAIEKLLDVAFGPDRFNKSSYSLRKNNQPVAGLSYVARHEGKIVGTVRYWPIAVHDLLGGKPLEALLLGPLAVSPALQGAGVGAQLMHKSLAAATGAGHQRILLVGDYAYYARFGFEPVLPRYITLPGGKDARRLLVRQPATISSLPSVGKIVVLTPEPVHVPSAASLLTEVA
ncbi:GNAT family N-acetyltransferase [Kordiimonas lacus]|uniref:Predicted N-acetyltransferase YhbS n=1 Tax=Kordiimonas lacus TaxID=637679 RepID=A0A1G7DBE2_9PROT|nr:N-acetyltransferase [Kordiimonas lacus]SDE48924.1 Predicted N-acetyltransferase YhbS [Kordiimonas lacus]